MIPALLRARFLIAFSCIAVLLSACAGAPYFSAESTVVVKSPNDTREYRALALDNGMKVLLISDPTAEKAAAAVDINAGSNSDPQDFAGLAHFLEHMLFLGTALYPESGEYQEYISAHGGSHNAYTGYANTNYYFDIDKDYLDPALDRFSQFFIAPLFTPDYVDRELILIRVKADAKARAEIMQICDIFRAKIIDVQPKHLAIEVTGSEGKIEKFLALMDPFGITELTRTGKIALSRSN